MISVIVRAYNSAATIQRAIESALNQTLGKDQYEVIVIDDGSTDATLDILYGYKNKIRLFEQGHKGPKVAVRKGINESKGEYIMFLDSDDEFLPETLQTMLEAFKNDPNASFAYCDYVEKVNDITKIISVKENIFNCIWTNVMFKKTLFDEIGLPPDDVFFGEYDFLIRLLGAGKVGKYISEPLYMYYRRVGSMTSNKEVVEKGIEQLRQKYGDIVNRIRKY